MVKLKIFEKGQGHVSKLAALSVGVMLLIASGGYLMNNSRNLVSSQIVSSTEIPESCYDLIGIGHIKNNKVYVIPEDKGSIIVIETALVSDVEEEVVGEKEKARLVTYKNVYTYPTILGFKVNRTYGKYGLKVPKGVRFKSYGSIEEKEDGTYKLIKPVIE